VLNLDRNLTTVHRVNIKTHLPPIQYYKFHPLGRPLVEQCIQRYGNTPNSEQVAKVVEKVIRQQYPQAFVPNSMLEREMIIDVITDSDVGRDFLIWWSAGKHIYLFSEELTQSFFCKDVDQLPTVILNPPFPAFYFKFGHRTAVETVPGKLRYLDGAYVAKCRGGLAITCTQCSGDGSTGSCGVSFFVDLSNHATVGQALTAGLQAQADEGTSKRSSRSGSANDFWRDTEEQRRVVFEHGLPIARDATKLIANGLAFIVSQKELITEDWLGAPDKMIKKFERSVTPSEQQRNLSKLWHQNFAKVYLCQTGRADADRLSASMASSSPDRGLQPGEWFAIGQVFCGPFCFDDPHSGTPSAKKYGVNVGVQSLAAMDVAAQRALHARPVPKTPSPFTATEVLEFIGEVFQKHGNPTKGILISKSVWQSSNEMLVEDVIAERAKALEQLDIQIDPMPQKDKDEIRRHLVELGFQVLFDESDLP